MHVLRNRYFAWRLRRALESEDREEAKKLGQRESTILNGPIENETCHSALTLSVCKRNLRSVKLVMSMGSNPNLAINVGTGLSALHYLAEHPYDDKAKQIYEEILACRIDKVDLDIEALQALHGGAYIGETPLMRAIRWENADFARQLIKSGASVKHIEPMMGATALLIACGEANYELIEMLLQNGADVKQASTGQFGVLHWLCANLRDAPECVELLINAGALVDQQSLQDQTTPLMLAARNGLYGCVETLIEYGADVGIRDCLGKTAICHARMNEDNEIAEAIIDIMLKKRRQGNA